jgi:hypothetical protein
MLEHGREYTSHLQAQAQAQLRDLVKRYPALIIVSATGMVAKAREDRSH